jgi:ABC-type antimicrobial peptide transport system permease subunit
MHSVTQRIHEIGIRIALGARRTDVLRLVVLDGIAWTALGIVSGVLAAVATGRAISGVLAGMRPPDLLTVVGAAAVVMLVAIAASLLPARRASRVDPIHALRHE